MALEPVGQVMALEAVVAKVMRDRPFFEASGGGVTLSGGEPTFNPTFCGALLKRFKAEGLHTLLQTCGHFAWPVFESTLLSYVDTIYCDIKLMDPDAHRRYCGVTNTRILENLENFLVLSQNGTLDFLPRVPLIPGITTTEENLVAIAEFLQDRGGRRVQVLAYNPLWHEKALRLGSSNSQARDELMHHFMDPAEVKRLSTLFIERGLEVV